MFHFLHQLKLPFKRLFLIIGFIWVLPLSVLVWFCLGLLKLFGQIDNVVFDESDYSFIWLLKEDSFVQKLAQGWFGCTLGSNLILVEDTYDIGIGSKFKHEKIHLKQYYIFGVFFLIVYIVNSAWLYLFNKDKHCYYDNFLEIWARKESGQNVEISRDKWRDGPDDRNPWF